MNDDGFGKDISFAIIIGLLCICIICKIYDCKKGETNVIVVEP